MKKRDISKMFIYRWRYQIGYGCLGLVFAFLLVFLSSHTPGGLTDDEMRSVVESNSVGEELSLSGIIDAPFRLLQKISVQIFGLSIISIKLPAIIIAFLTGLGLIVLLNRWYKSNVAVLASGLAITSGMFLFVAQNGTPNIMYVFWPTVIMILGSLILNEDKPKFWCVVGLAAALGLSLYSPFMVCIVGAIMIATIIHPHLRFTVKSLGAKRIAVGVAVFSIVVVPIILAAIRGGDISELIGIDAVSGTDMIANLKMAILPFISFNSSVDGIELSPIFGLPIVVLLLLGFTNSLKERYTAKNYILTIWVLLSVAIVGLTRGMAVIMLLPFTILLASGLEFVIEKWYGLFPENPYARVGGLIPISFFIIVTIGTGVLHFAYGYYFTPQVARHFNDDLELISKYLVDDAVIVAPSESMEYKFYKTLEDGGDVIVIDSVPEDTVSRLIVVRDFDRSEVKDYELAEIITSSRTNDSDRFYVYQYDR